MAEPALPWKHVRQPGEDVAPGEVVLPAGSPDLSGGSRSVPGSGSGAADRFASAASSDPPHRLRNGPSGASFETGTVEGIQQHGVGRVSGGVWCGAGPQGVVPDREEALRAGLSECGGSMRHPGGECWFFRRQQGLYPTGVGEVGKVLLHGVAARPGRPVVLANIGETPAIGLPGYPVSAYLAFDWFVRPLIRHWYR